MKQFLISPLQVRASTPQTCALVSPGAWCQVGNHLTSFFILQKAEATGEKRPRGRPRKWVSNKKQFLLLSSNEKSLLIQMKVTFTFQCHACLTPGAMSLERVKASERLSPLLTSRLQELIQNTSPPLNLGVTPFPISYQHEKRVSPLPSSPVTMR